MAAQRDATMMVGSPVRNHAGKDSRTSGSGRNMAEQRKEAVSNGRKQQVDFEGLKGERGRKERIKTK